MTICAGRSVAVAWTLGALCVVGHSHHFLSQLDLFLLHMLHSNAFHACLSVAVSVGPGRMLLVDGWNRLCRISPNMNTVVGLGAVS